MNCIPGVLRKHISCRIVIKDSDIFCNIIKLNLKLDKNTLCLTGLYLIGHAHLAHFLTAFKESLSEGIGGWLVGLFLFV